MLKKIQELEKIAKTLQPKPELFNRWNQQTTAYAENFYAQLNELPAYDQMRAQQDSNGLSIDGESNELKDLLKLIWKELDRNGINPASPGHFGYVPGGGLFPSALGDYLAAITNRYSGLFFANPGSVRMENELLRWMCRIVGYPETALGNLCSGGSIANLIAITTAREHKNLKARDFERQVIYLTSQTHHCAQKAIRIAGLGEALIRYIPVDKYFRLQTEALDKQIIIDKQNGLSPFMVVASAGTTDTGAMDPLESIAKICHQHEVWMHVDAAYGGFFILVDSLKPIFKGIEQADSITIDPHKGLFMPYGSGAVLIKNVQAQYQAHFYSANYLQDTDLAKGEISPADLSPELTKHARGLRMWIPLKIFGIEPFKAALEEKILLCRYFYHQIEKLGFEVGCYPDLSIMIFRYPFKNGDANAFNERLVEEIRKDGRVFLSTTTIDGIYWIRIAVICFRSHKEQVDLCLQLLSEFASKLESKGRLQ